MNKWTILLLALSANLQAATKPYCAPNQPCWPKPSEWEALNKQVNGHLIKGSSPLAPCIQNSKSESCITTLDNLKNPFYIESQPGGTQTTGWLYAWNAAISPYIVAVESPKEIADAIQFARKHHIKLAVKGTGHDYLGRSNAPNSLLIWTHNMRNITMNDQFIPTGCAKEVKPQSAVSIEAGVRWLEAYDQVVTQNGRYVQGGGCTSVGAAGGFIQGGGFGSFSKKYGTGSAGILEAELVKADGSIIVANACQNTDLFWALKGGGGGTYGVVSKITLLTHPLPNEFGTVTGTISAKTDKDYKELIGQFMNFYKSSLNNEHWGEQVKFNPKNELNISMLFEGLSRKQVDEQWQPFKKWLEERPNQYQFKIDTVVVPAQHFWDLTYFKKNLPDLIKVNDLKDAPSGEFWWAGNQEEVSGYITHYQSAYLPKTLFSEDKSNRLVNTLYDTSRIIDFSLHFNKGLANSSAEAIKRQADTSMNPKVLDATALLIMSGGQQYKYPLLKNHAPDLSKAKADYNRSQRAMLVVQRLVPDAATYPNETDFELPNWQSSLWGSNYPKLLDIKRKYDPDNIFTCHHCVGSE